MKRSDYKLFENAIDSLEVGIEFYLNEGMETAHKHAILNIFHSIELLLKERLVRVDPIYIYQEANAKLIKENSKTIGFEEILRRFSILGIVISKEELKEIRILQSKRNRIIHFEFVADEIGDADILGMSLKFIKDFMEEHLETKLKNEIDVELYDQIEEIVDSFEERYMKATKLAEELVAPHCKDDLCDSRDLLECPECGTNTLVCVGGPGTCTLCEKEFDVGLCSYCGHYATDLNEIEYCGDCASYSSSRD